jgi:hypothetical protein
MGADTTSIPLFPEQSDSRRHSTRKPIMVQAASRHIIQGRGRGL